LKPQNNQTLLTYFLHELTIVGRIVWADEELNPLDKVCGLKWINEINHRVINVMLSQREDLEPLKAQIKSHADQSEAIRFDVGQAWKRALDKSAK